jgi:diguanylate cyclase (GGDEF)-like protein
LQRKNAFAVDDAVPRTPIRRHQHRLEALWDLSLQANESAETQIQALLRDATAALECEYAELYCVEEASFVAAGSHSAPEALGSRINDSTDTLIVYDTDEEPMLGSHPVVTATPLRSIYVLPLTNEELHYRLVFGWRRQRSASFTDEEARYVKFLARIIRRRLELARKEQELSSKIVTDELTGLYNRAAMLEQIAIAISAAERNGSQVALFYIDLDGFKSINDTHGHTFGDAAISETARRIRAVLRKHEVAGRIGGDEFALLITSFVSESQLVQVARRILDALREPISIRGMKMSVGASIGIAVYPRDTQSAEELLARADTAMYHAKRVTGDDHMFYSALDRPGTASPDLFTRGEESASIERELFLCYQPIIDARSGKAVAAEALLRWLHPERGLLAPAAFLQASREQQLLQRIEDFALSKAADKASELRVSGRTLAIHVNVTEPNDNLLRSLPQRCANIAFEIAEEAFANDRVRYMAFMEACRERGFTVGLTHFGSGGLSLRDLPSLPITFVKIGRDALPERGQTQGGAAGLLVDTAHRLGWNVIAESVEEQWQRDWLLASGVDALQGYLLCGPLTETDLDDWLQATS